MNTKTIKYNIRFNIRVLQSIFKYFDINENNIVIEIITKNKETISLLKKEYDSYVIKFSDNSIIFKNLKFEKLTNFILKHSVFNIYFYKVNKNFKIDNLHNSEVCIHLRLDTIDKIIFDKDKFDEKTTKEFLKKYRVINIEYIILFLLLVVGILIQLLK